jgi:hypothetical protein
VYCGGTIGGGGGGGGGGSLLSDVVLIVEVGFNRRGLANRKYY